MLRIQLSLFLRFAQNYNPFAVFNMRGPTVNRSFVTISRKERPMSNPQKPATLLRVDASARVTGSHSRSLGDAYEEARRAVNHSGRR